MRGGKRTRWCIWTQIPAPMIATPTGAIMSVLNGFAQIRMKEKLNELGGGGGRGRALVDSGGLTQFNASYPPRKMIPSYSKLI